MQIYVLSSLHNIRINLSQRNMSFNSAITILFEIFTYKRYVRIISIKSCTESANALFHLLNTKINHSLFIEFHISDVIVFVNEKLCCASNNSFGQALRNLVLTESFA